MKLLLDEMLSFRIAEDLRQRGHDVDAVKRHRPELESVPDLTLVDLLMVERRAIVTNNIGDFRAIHNVFQASGRDHAGMIFTFDSTLPRTRGGIPRWVQALDGLLQAHPATDHALLNQVRHLP